MTYKLTNHKPEYFNDSDFGLQLDSDVVKAAILTNSDIYEFKFSTVSTFFDLWSLGDTPSRIYPYIVTGPFCLTSSRTFHVPYFYLISVSRAIHDI